jgi:putative serine protease PepD
VADGQPSTVSRWQRVPVVAGVLGLVALAAAVIGGLVVARVSSDRAQRSCRAIQVADLVLPSVVTIRTTSSAGSGNGSGEIIRSGGYILTNDHVISSAADGGEVSVLYSDGHSSPASIVGRDPDTDLAVIEAEDKAAGFPLIRVTSSADVQVGQPVVALGAPLGLDSTVTEGIVSALDRYVTVPAGDGQTAHLIDALQTDAAINPGNSGGALVNCSGELVGVNTAISTVPNAEGVSGGGSVGLGFAIPSDLAKPLSGQLIGTGQPNHPTFGLEAHAIDTSTSSPSGERSGLFVTVVTPGGPAAEAGLRPGDIITSLDGEPATRVDQLVVLTLTKEPGDDVAVTYSRGGTSHTTTMTLAAST